MGVPKFFRWISERYPNLSVNVENNQIPIFDCLYLDMNGIIHICSHPDDSNVHFRITEEQIFTNIFNYIEFLFKTVKPKEVFFLAVDGVAPRAKMNQQRSRRFKSVKEAKNREEMAVQNGVILPTEKRFDSNAITPGTEFMDRLQQALKAFLSEKIKSDILWHDVDVILSGHETPGEGEHKIQEYIRYRRSLPNYNPNTRHCLYGLDADLLLLGLASHEPYFSLLREEVTFSTRNHERRAYIAEETKFFLLHLSLLRDYIDYEFSSLKVILKEEYDLERIIDDWIVLSFFVGNDFVPHLPDLHIHSNALPILWETYIRARPTMDSYLNDNGTLSINNLLIYVTDLAQFDTRNLKEMFDDIQWMFGKTGEKMAKELECLDKKVVKKDAVVEEHALDETIQEVNGETESDENNIDIEEIEDSDVAIDSIVPLNISESEMLEKFSSLHIEEEDGNEIWKMEFHRHKTEYYYNKLGLHSSPEMLQAQANEYFTALQWICYYYFTGVPSWSWFYPQHYAPFVSDLLCLGQNIKDHGIIFDIGKPFFPFEQLMAVLPSQSSELLPDCFSTLMIDEYSPIIDFYPKTFKSDLNGKKREWEALVLIPFIDEKRLLISLETQKHLLSDDEKRRNSHGPHIAYRFSDLRLTVTEIDPKIFRISRKSVVKGLLDNVQLDVIRQGFPTLNHIEHSFNHERAFVKLFENCSTLTSIVLKITPHTIRPTCESVANTFLEKLVYVNWPSFILSKVVGVLDHEKRITLDPITKELIIIKHDEKKLKQVNEYISAQPQESYKGRAIVLDSSNMIILETLHSEGNIYEVASTEDTECRLKMNHNWNTERTHWHLHQLSVLHEMIGVLDRKESKICTSLSQLFQKGEIVFCLSSKYYGQSGRIISVNNIKQSISVNLDPLTEPTYNEIDVNDMGVEYMTASQASSYLDMDALLLSKITGSNFISKSKNNDSKNKHKSNKKDRLSIGLDLKNNKLNLQVPGWVIKTGSDNGVAKWLYSMRVIKLLDDYRDKFPEVFAFIKKPNYESLTMEDMFEITGDMKMLDSKCEELRKYLDVLECKTVEKLSNDHLLLTEYQISKLEKTVENLQEHSHLVMLENCVELEFDFKELFRPHYSLDGTKADMSTEYRLLDRVVCCTEGYTVPMGLRGVIIGIAPTRNGQIKLEVLFDRVFKSAISIRGSQARCYRMPPHTLINTSHGIRKHNCAHELVAKITLDAVDHVEEGTPKKVINGVVNEGTKPDFMRQCSSSSVSKLPKVSSEKSQENASGTNKSSNAIDAEHDEVKNERKNKQKKVEPKKQQQMAFLAHCDNVYKNTMTSPLQFTTIIDTSNCPYEYQELFYWCLQYGITNPIIIERWVDQDVFMSFKCDQVELMEVQESSVLHQGRYSHSGRVWRSLGVMWQQWEAAAQEAVPSRWQGQSAQESRKGGRRHTHNKPQKGPGGAKETLKGAKLDPSAKPFIHSSTRMISK